MTTIYCSKCGNKVEQKGVIVNFCSKCGQDLRTLKQTQTIANEDTFEEADQVGEFDISNLKDKIKITVDMDIPKPITIGDLVSEAKQTGPVQEEKYVRPSSNLPKGKDLLKTIAKECSSSREAPIEVE